MIMVTIPHFLMNQRGAEDETGNAPGVATAPGGPLKDGREHDHAATQRRLILEALERCRGNMRAVAGHLQIAPKTLCRL